MGEKPTLLVGADGAAWHAWRTAERKPRDLVLLDPADAHYGPAGRLRLIRGDRAISTTFFGAMDAQRAPHLVLAACAELLGQAEGVPCVQLFPYRPSPLMRQLAQTIAFMIRPDEILIATGTAIEQEGWPVGPEMIDLPSGLPPVVVQAQRKAQWLKMIEQSQVHEIPLWKTSIQGLRLGSGVPLNESVRQRAGLSDVLHAEVCGSSLFIVSEQDLDEDRMSRALDVAHVSRAHIVHPGDYQNLLCAFMRPSGDTFGYGRIESIDFESGLIRTSVDAVPPVPVPILRVGSLRVDVNGRELGEAKPWSL